jgi:hypothetical protein
MGWMPVPSCERKIPREAISVVLEALLVVGQREREKGEVGSHAWARCLGGWFMVLLVLFGRWLPRRTATIISEKQQIAY